MPNQSSAPERPGAPESNAGDEFHVLWAARRAVRLLDAASPLQRVIVEGVGPADDPDGDDAFLGADLAEFEGGDTFADAERTVLSQLKYSTRHPGRAWTAARLASGGHGPKQKRPVIYRLAQQLRVLVEAHSAPEVLARLRVRLVSNQPTAPPLLSALEQAKRLLTGPTPPSGTKRMLERIEESDAEDIRRLYEASGLGSRDFLYFLQVLDLSGTGEESVDLQRVRLVQELGLAVTLDPTRGVRALERLIAIDASPHGVGSLGLTASDVFAALDVTSPSDLYPAPSRFHPPEDPVPVGEAAALAATLVGAGGNPVVAHGPAGVGKTTTLLQVGRHLPAGSEVLVYDCYGNGSYLDPGSERHTPRRALTQLTNEIATRFGTPFLLDRDLDGPDLYRRFLEALNKSGSLMPSGAVLVVAIDAADNAGYAARLEGDQSFVPRLLRARLPDSVRLLASCRTHRVAEITPPEWAVEHELRGFDLAATALHIRRRFAAATDEDVEAIHERTGGGGRSLANPRVQGYVLRTSSSLGEALGSASSTPQKIFDDLFASAVDQAPDKEQALSWVGLLVAMGRPAPVSAFAAFVAADEETAGRFVRALEPGVVLEDEGGETVIGFRDEDFETDLRDRVGPDALRQSHARLGRLLLGRAATDPYAASVVADHLFAAGLQDDLLALVLDGPRPDAIADPLARLRVNRRRSSLGLRAAAAGDDRVATARVLFAAAEFARGEEATLRLIREAPGLAVRFGDPETVAGVYVRESTDPWKGPAHLHSAVLLARAGDSDGALDHAKAAGAWMRRRQSLVDSDEADGWHLSIEDIAHEAEVAYRLRGADAAYGRVTRWHPRTVRAQAARAAVRSVALRVDVELLEVPLTELALSAVEAAVVIEAAWSAGAILGDEVVSRTAEGVASLVKPSRRHRGEVWAVGFAEAAARAGVDTSVVSRILDAFGPAPPVLVPEYFSGLDGVADSLRAAVLLGALRGEPVTAAGLRPPSTEALPDTAADASPDEVRRTRESNERRKEDRERWDALVGAALPGYRFRAEALLGRVTPAEAADAPAVIALRPWQPGEDRRPGSYSRFRHNVAVLLEGLGFSGADAGAVSPILDALGEADPEGRADAWLEVAQSVGRWTSLAPASERAVERAVEAVADEALPARERWTVLWKAADLVQHADAAWAAALYARAVEAASDLDDDGAYLLGTLARVLESTGSAPADLGGRSLARRITRAVEHHTPYVSDERYLPKEGCVRATAAVDAQEGLALAARWDDEDRFDLASGVQAVCVVTGATGGLEPEEVMALLRLVPYGVDATADLLPHLDRLRAGGLGGRARLSALVRDVAEWTLRDVPAGGRRHVAERLAEWAERNGLAGLPGMGDVARTSAFLQELDGHERRRRKPNRPASTPGAQTEWEAERSEMDRSANAAYDAAVLDAARGMFDHLGERLADAARRPKRPALLRAVREATPRRHRNAYLEALVSLTPGQGGESLWSDDVLYAFSEALNAWSSDPGVLAWTADGVHAFSERWVPWLIRGSYEVARVVRTLFDLPGLGGRGPEETIDAVARRIDDLSAESLLRVGGVLAEGFTRDEKRALVDAVLNDWEGTAGVDVSQPPSPALPPSLAGFLWSAFGHHDQELRWRALHAARAIVRLTGGTPLLDGLIERSQATDAGPYRDPARVFYWQAALASLYTLLLRLVHENPGSVRPYADEILGRALSTSFPHVQVRELARRTALALEADTPGTYAADVVARLRVVNQPLGRSESADDESYYRNPYDMFWGDKKEGIRFKFNYMDQVSYWYAWAERRLDVPEMSVLKRADRWICDEWGLPDVNGRNDPRSRDPYDRRDARVYKGSYPRYMGTQEHLTLHAMFCAVGELLDGGAALRQDPFDREDDYDEWAGWTRPYLPASDREWAHDVLGPTPLDPLWWGDVPAVSEWADTGGLVDYDRLLGLPDGAAAMPVVPCDEIVVRQSSEAWSSGAYDYVRVNSCLVTPETAEALQRACQSHPDWQSNAFPTGWHDEVLDTPGFTVRPWVENDGPEEALDTFDPFLFGRGLNVAGPTAETASALGLVKNGRDWFDDRGRAAFRVETWSDRPPGRDEGSGPFSQGSRLWVRLDVLLPYLSVLGFDLLIEAAIQHHDRRDTSYGSSSDRPGDDGHAVYTLIRRDGTFRSLDVDRRFGRAYGA